jgi:hypothetical protein
MRIRNVLMILFGVIVFAAILALGWRHHGPNNFDAAFQAGGNINLDLSVGGYTIEGSNENQIRVEINPKDASYVHSRVQVSGNTANVSLDGPNSNFHAVIYVPQRSNLVATQTIGQLKVVNVEGDKSLGLNIGELRLEVPDPNAVKSIDASVRLGDIHAAAWHRGHGGLFPSFHARGAGPYSIRASVDIGNIELGK